MSPTCSCGSTGSGSSLNSQAEPTPAQSRRGFFCNTFGISLSCRYLFTPALDPLCYSSSGLPTQFCWVHSYPAVPSPVCSYSPPTSCSTRLLIPSALPKLLIVLICLPLVLPRQSSPDQKGPAFPDSNFYLQLQRIEWQRLLFLHLSNMAVGSGLLSSKVSCELMLSCLLLHSIDKKQLSGCILQYLFLVLQVPFSLLLLILH